MADDVATLGLAVDSTQVTAATAALNQLVPAAKAAETSITSLSAIEKAMAAAAGDLNVQNRALTNGTTLLGAAHGGMSTQAMAAQHSLRSMVEQLAMGVPPTMIFTQQLNHLAFAATGPGGVSGAFKEAGASLLKLISPTTLLVGGIAGVAAAAYLINSSWKTTALQFDDAAKAIGGTINQLRALSNEASVKGIPVDDFLKSSEKFAGNIYDAKAGMGQLASLLRANGSSATTFADTMGKVADLVRSSAGDTQKQFAILRDAGLPATMEYVRLLSSGSQGLKDAARAAGQMTDQEQKLVDQARAFDEAWNRTWNSWANTGRAAVMGVKSVINSISDFGIRSRAKFNPNDSNSQVANRFVDTGINNPGLEAGLNKVAGQKRGDRPVVDPAIAAHQLSIEQQRISVLGQTASIDQQVRAAEIGVLQARANGVDITKTELATIKSLAYENALGLTAMRQQTDAFKTEADTIGMSVGQAAQYTAVTNALNQAKREHKVLTDQNIADLNTEASALGKAAAAAEETRFEFDTFQSTFREFGQNIRNGQSVWEAFGKAGSSALGKIADRLMDMATRNLWTAAFGGKSGGGGLLSLFGFGGGGASAPTMVVGGAGSMAVPTFHTGGIIGEGVSSRMVDAAVFANAPRFHSGGLVGDEVPLIGKKGEGVFTGAQMRAMGGRGGGSIQMSPTYIFQNADPGSEARMRMYVDRSVQQSQGDTLAAVKKYHQNAPGSYLPAGA